MDLALSNEELQSDHTKIDEILTKLQIDQSTGNLSIPQDRLQSVALFTMMVPSQQESCQSLEREVIAIYENTKNPSELSEGNVIV